ncbi:unnamed protein product [Oikopleura dioica]|uniref:Uncharacterized protein n=1 Tax=Oikopleura dioica TaxID=34765 RepID=E4YU65_OIKDI|nr:unnamed protein product [Oikopleura dioica]
MENLKIEGKFVVANNNSGPCCYCSCFFEKMYHNGGWSKMCRPCAKAKKGVDKDYSKGKDELITTTFKCPAEKCSVNTLKFKDFVLGKLLL